MEILSLNKYLYANGNAINGLDPSGKFTIVEVLGSIANITALATLGTTSIFAPLISSQYVPSPATSYEKGHRTNSKNILQFLNYLNGKSLRDFQGNESTSDIDIQGFRLISIPFFEGPPGAFRYLEDPADPDRAIDMVHFINFGLNPLYGWPNELRQATGDSSWILEDLRSNYFGEIFFRDYHNQVAGMTLKGEFSIFYADIASGKVKFTYR